MTAGRCDDPSCTCRSDELQWFTNSVLRRDAAKTDYIVIPLVGGVLARCFLARDGPNPEGENRETSAIALAIIDLAARNASQLLTQDSPTDGDRTADAG